jgi:large subunit ribosomal protein L17
MRKLKHGRKFGRKRDQRKALSKALVRTFVFHEKIKTTEAKAKEISGFVEKFITQAKKKDLSSRRRLSKFLAPKAIKKICDEIAPRFKDRKGGYTRVIKLGQRKSDGAKMAIIELVK